MIKNIDIIYLDLLEEILTKGVKKSDRTGTGTLSVFGKSFKINMEDGFPLLTTKKVWYKGVLHELLWFLKGDTNIKYLIDNDVDIWTEWAYKKFDLFKKFVEANKNNTGLVYRAMYEGLNYYYFSPTYEHYISNKKYLNDIKNVITIDDFRKYIKVNESFAKRWGDLGPVYGYQWRYWGTAGIDQIQNVINTLKTNPDSRRMIVSTWNVGDLDDMSLEPCHYSFQFYSRELTLDEKMKWVNTKRIAKYPGDFDGNLNDPKNCPQRALSLLWNQRSVDVPLGLPFNIASYATLLHMIADQTDHEPYELIANLGDTHIYLNQIEGVKEQLTKVPYPLPSIDINKNIKTINDYKFEDFKIINYDCHPAIKFPISV